MSQSIAARTAKVRDTGRATTVLTTVLLSGGVLAGSLFMVVALAQAFTRPGFDLRRHAISMLSLGDLGWIQVTDFVVSGALFIALAVGIRRVLHPGQAGTWGPLLVGSFGTGLAIAGLFSTDPALGFPPGAPAGMPSTMSWHAMLHSLGFFVAFTSLTAACFVLVRGFASRGQRRWAVASAATGVATPLLIVLGMTSVIATGVAFAMAGMLTTWWLAAVAARLAADPTRGRPATSAQRT
jgi:Protein of unknown function (DUF998)